MDRIQYRLVDGIEECVTIVVKFQRQETLFSSIGVDYSDQRGGQQNPERNCNVSITNLLTAF